MIKYRTEIVTFNLFVPKLLINQKKHLPVILLTRQNDPFINIYFFFFLFYTLI